MSPLLRFATANRPAADAEMSAHSKAERDICTASFHNPRVSTLAERYAQMRDTTRVHERALFTSLRFPSELELQARWFAGDFGKHFVSTAGDKIEIIQFGTWNREAGPDFRDAAIRINDEEPVGGAPQALADFQQAVELAPDRPYFRAQLPEPWPVLKPPATPSLEERNPPARSRSRLRSRVALAAALTALLIGQWFVSGLFSNYVHVAADGNRDRIEATNRHGPVKAPKLAPAQSAASNGCNPSEAVA